MRLIDANELRNRLQNLSYDDWNQGVSTSWAEAYSEIADMINNAPIIDAEPVVRCMDCKYLQWNMRQDGSLPLGVDEYECRHWCGCCDPMDFCSYGERREE